MRKRLYDLVARIGKVADSLKRVEFLELPSRQRRLFQYRRSMQRPNYCRNVKITTQ
jgi:hypothetical protein